MSRHRIAMPRDFSRRIAEPPHEFMSRSRIAEPPQIYGRIAKYKKRPPRTPRTK